MSIESALKARGLRATRHRIALVGTLATANTPKTAEEIRDRMEEIDLVTVYRNLQALTRAGITREVRFKDAAIRYELAGDSHHHHVVCTGCGVVDELDECDVAPIERKALTTSKRFASIEEHALEFFGTCRACAVKR